MDKIRFGAVLHGQPELPVSTLPMLQQNKSSREPAHIARFLAVF